MIGISKRESIKFMIVALALLNTIFLAYFIASSFATIPSRPGSMKSMFMPAISNGFLMDGTTSNIGIDVEEKPSISSSAIHETVSTFTLTVPMVSPETGSQSTYFTFSVVYTNPTNNAPDYMQVIINSGSDYTYYMQKQNANDYTYTDGCVFYCTIQLPAGNGNYEYYFIARCGNTAIQTTIKTGPTIPPSSIFSDPGSMAAIVLISVGVFMSILIPALAHNIRVKKSVMAFVPSSSHPPPSGNNVIPVPGMLPRSAFVQQPLQVLSTTSSVPPPLVVSRTFTQNFAPPPVEPILPGSPKWARLARFDISQYMTPVDDQALPMNDGEHVADETIQDGIRITRTNAEPGIETEVIPAPEEIMKQSPMQSMAMHQETMIPTPKITPHESDALGPLQDAGSSRVEENILYIARAEFEINVPAEPTVTIQLSCTQCGIHLDASTMIEGLVYFCKACQKAMILEVSCPKCFGITTMTQDKKISSNTRSYRCPICFEALIPL